MFINYFLNRPTVVYCSMVLLFAVGLLASFNMPVALFPTLKNNAISITAYYPGANAEVMNARVASIFESSVSTIDMVDYTSAASADGFTSVTVNLKPSADSKTALIEVIESVRSARGLPSDLEPPSIHIATASSKVDLGIAFYSEEMSRGQMYEYLTRVLKPRLESVEGVADASVLGSEFVVKISLDNEKLIAFGIDANDVVSAISKQNIPATGGYLQNATNRYVISAVTNVADIEGFENIKVISDGISSVNLSDVATVRFAANNENIVSSYNGRNATVLTVKLNSQAMPLRTETALKDILKQAESNYPYDLKSEIIADTFIYIRASLMEVLETMLISVVIVFFVLYFTTGTMNTVIVPLVTIPISIVAVVIVLNLLGLNFDTLTLLGIVLAIGIVVDDAIVVYDNILSKIEQGVDVEKAVSVGTHEIAFPIIGITASFISIYIPILFVGGIIGELLTPFVVALAGAVMISGVVSLVLTPTMCRMLLKNGINRSRLGSLIEVSVYRLREGYRTVITWLVYRPWLVFCGLFLTVGFVVYSAGLIKKELAPAEDGNLIIVIAEANSSASTSYVNSKMAQYQEIVKSLPHVKNYNFVTGIPDTNKFLSFIRLDAWGKRQIPARAIQGMLQGKLSALSSMSFISFVPSNLPGSSSIPFQVVVHSDNADYKDLNDFTKQLLMKLRRSGVFTYVTQDLKYDLPTVKININRQKAAMLGVEPADIANLVSVVYSSGYVQKVALHSRTYDVIVHSKEFDGKSIEELDRLKIKNVHGELVPLSELATYEVYVRPRTLTKFKNQGAITISGDLIPGRTLSEAVDAFVGAIDGSRQSEYAYDFVGETRSFTTQEKQVEFIMVMIMVLIIFFLIILFNGSMSYSLLVVGCVFPLSLFGAFSYLYYSGNSLNLFSQVAVLTLVGLILKHAILVTNLIVQNQHTLPIKEVVINAAVERFRAIVMTTLSMILGAVPLCMAMGPGAEYRQSIGWVILVGMMISTCLLLLVFPPVVAFFKKCSVAEMELSSNVIHK